MDPKTVSLIAQLKNNPNLAKQLLSSGDGQALMDSLTRKDGGSSLRQAAANAAKGDTTALSVMLGDLMRSPEGAALIQRLGNSIKQHNS